MFIVPVRITQLPRLRAKK